MATSDWRNHIDLTNDSDDDLLPAPRPQPKKTPVPLPANVRHLYESPPVPKKTPSQTPNSGEHNARPATVKASIVPLPPSYRAGLSTPSNSVGSSRPTSANASSGSGAGLRVGQLNGSRDSYVPVFSGAQNKGNGSHQKEQPKKRRKLDSVSSKPAPASTTKHSSTKLSAMNGAPTVHSLNSALKSHGASKGISLDVLTSEARTLDITRADDDDDELTGFAVRTPQDSSIEKHMVPSEPELGASDLEEDGWDDPIDDTWLTYETQKSPLKKHTHGTPSSHSKKSKSSTAIVDSHFTDVAHAPPTPDHSDTMKPISPEPLTNGHEEMDWSPPAPKEDGSNTLGPNTGPKRVFSDDDHLLIYLKEVQKLKWSEIEKHFPGRRWTQLQSRYSCYFSKRDRSLDPPTLGPSAPYPAMAPHHRSTVVRNDESSGTDASVHKPVAPRKVTRPSARDEPTPDSDSQHVSDRPAGRSRRNVQTVNYTWPRQRRRHPDAADHFEDEEIFFQPPEETSSSEPSDVPSVGPDVVIPLSTPMDVDFVHEDASVVVTGQRMPYLSFAERSVLRTGSDISEWEEVSSRKWQGSIVHIDFSQDELDIVEKAVHRVIGGQELQETTGRRRRLQRVLKNQSESKLARISYEIRKRLLSRDQESIDAFLQDARSGKLPTHPRIERLGPVRPDRDFSSNYKASTSTFVRQRELGLQSRRGWKATSTPLSYQMKNHVYDTLGPAFSYTGASSDVHTVAWSPDGRYFAAGAVCVTDPDSMQYNRPNNLLYGDISSKTIHELGEHRTNRGRPDKGPNSTHEMYVSQDPYLYHTVSAVAFSTRGDYMFSAGYDQHVIVWDTSGNDSTSGSQPQFVKALAHKAEVDILAVSCKDQLATGSRRWEKAVKVCTIREEGQEVIPNTYSSRKADQRPDLKILPTALKFEPTYGRLLLAGFGANQREDRMDINGDICLWDVETRQELDVYGSTKNIFDVAWVPNQVMTSLFAVGCVASGNVNRGTRSLVRLYDGRGYEKRTMVMEAECPALDMNDVVFCPYDVNLVAAGCTNGRTYVWDLRRPDDFLYALSHGKSLMPLDENQDREVTDTGVRFLSWGENATRLYTGSSDGVVKVWDVARSLPEVFIKDLVTCDSGIMSGAFSSDYSKLIVGEVNGSINVLEVGNDDFSLKDAEKLRHISYEEVFDEDDGSDAGSAAGPIVDSGKTIASDLLATKQMMNVRFGGFPIRQAVQGPNYAGPFDHSVDAPYLREQALEFQMSLANPPGPQCSIPSCKDIVTITHEEIGDSGRSLDRIPDELRKQWKMLGSDLTVTAGKSKCANCGRPAHPSSLCERCEFACFRCGGVCKMSSETQKLLCRTCFRVWDVGVLGYECVEEGESGVLSSDDVPALPNFAKDLETMKTFRERNVSYGDEMNALTDYYLDMALERPESPPL